MSRLFIKLASGILTAALLIPVQAYAQQPSGQAQADTAYTPRAQLVTDNVYAIIGPLGQRSQANAGLNANYGFVIGDTGVLLVDSGASAYAAKMLKKAVAEVTDKPIRWVLNTGSQDHRWLGNDYFAKQGATVYAMHGTPETQARFADQQIESIKRFVGEQLEGTIPKTADQIQPAPTTEIILDGVRLQWIQTNAHYPGDTMIYLPTQSVVFTGDLVYVDRLLGVLPQSNVRAAARAFDQLKDLNPKFVVPGHGRVTDIDQAQRETGDYYQFLIQNVGEAGRNMEPLQETLDQFAAPAQFMHLQNFDELHRVNMNRVFVDFETNP
ncbi:MAG: MBL fold metallo-hydrolase [Burkholderiaceae bacterium]|nr:MBL fold metallo-hydrolase [Burkholderiaceae bacterium]MCD8517041.1 MBL fold metallo-hydrolase [Burkholderiaceae bacterium]MCD8536912.1 MBL fold metallo-hydrolase [Burkholderiaceae bacterium]MCD8566062.1 MBL fold metallo-hydrolase [Burkholderiaceae bacterium]